MGINITSGLQYDQFSNEIYTGIIFKSGTGTLSFTGIIPNVSILAIGGGGGGGLDSSNGYPGGGGGGAGYYYVNNYTFIANNPINITVGSGGKGREHQTREQT